jgi:NADH-quinone oxidoreductase subunit D
MHQQRMEKMKDGSDKLFDTEIPFRVKSRGPSFSNLSVLPELAKGIMIADLIAIIGSIDFVLGEVDR